jgi:hypothetical protein
VYNREDEDIGKGILRKGSMTLFVFSIVFGELMIFGFMVANYGSKEFILAGFGVVTL